MPQVAGEVILRILCEGCFVPYHFGGGINNSLMDAKPVRLDKKPPPPPPPFKGSAQNRKLLTPCASVLRPLRVGVYYLGRGSAADAPVELVLAVLMLWGST